MNNLYKIALVFVVLFIDAFDKRLQQKIEQDISKIILDVDKDINIGLSFYSLKNGCVYINMSENHLFVPASNTKLFTVAAAFHILGPEYKFETKLYLDNKNLYLKGSGDPSLKTQDLENLLLTLKKKKIKNINNIILDSKCFDEALFGKGWMWDEAKVKFNSPVSGLNINHNCVKLKSSEVTVDNPILYVGDVIKDVLRKFDIKFTGKILLDSVDDKAKLYATHKSENLSEIAKVVLKDSDNLYAECLFRAIGSCSNQSKNILYDFLNNTVKIDTTRLVIVDGSGMSRYNLISANHITGLLEWIYKKSNFKNIFFKCLPKISHNYSDGTLKNRINNANFILAKTGSMQGVSSLSGYLMTPDKDPLVFSILINGFSGSNKNYKSLEDNICLYFDKFKKIYSNNL